MTDRTCHHDTGNVSRDNSYCFCDFSIKFLPAPFRSKLLMARCVVYLIKEIYSPVRATRSIKRVS